MHDEYITYHSLDLCHCQQKGPYYRDRVPIGTFLASWVPIGSLFIFQGPYFRFFGFIYAKNVNSVCMYTTMSYLDLSVMSNDMHCYYTYCEVMLHVFIIKDNWPVTIAESFSHDFHKSLFWFLILAAGGTYWVLISQTNGSLLGPYFTYKWVPIGSLSQSWGVPISFGGQC